MKNVIVAGVAALALIGCGAKEEAAVEAAPAAEEVKAEEPVAEVVETPAEEVKAEAPAAEEAKSE